MAKFTRYTLLILSIKNKSQFNLYQKRVKNKLKILHFLIHCKGHDEHGELTD